MNSTFVVDLEKISHTANIAIVVLCGLFGVAGYFVSFYFHFLTVAFFLLGLVVQNDGGRLVGMLVVVLLCAGYVLVSRRKELPLVGDTF